MLYHSVQFTEVMRKIILLKTDWSAHWLHSGDPFRQSLMGRPFWLRFLIVAIGLVLFWLAVAWAVAVP
jgi:hypothetical protein